MYSPQKSLTRDANSSGKRKSNITQDSSPGDARSYDALRVKVKQPFVQDTLHRLTSPYKKSCDSSSAKLMNTVQFDFPRNGLDDTRQLVTTPKKPRTATGRHDLSEKSKSQRGEPSEVFPNQGIVEDDLKDSLTTLKMVMRDYEEKQKEKKTLQKIVDQLKIQIEGLKARKNNFTKNFEKLHTDSLLMNDAAALKENQRKLIVKNIEQVKDTVVIHDREIQDSICQNVDVANKIKAEQLAILKIKEHIADLKKNIPFEMKEKEKARSSLQISSKQLKSSLQKYESLTKEKTSFVETVKGTRSSKI